ncbi:MAG TPA: DNA internalization-related competence protein ComEC/Rec2 [Thermoanaerobaculia bacterium]|nr:DNA internalization-related competence protein ComEC/Rec2 [Thermoanaerobaculia bacterium]
MSHEKVPAALPLIGLIAGFTCGGSWIDAIAFATIAILALMYVGQASACPDSTRDRRDRLKPVLHFLLFLVIGIVLAMRVQHREAREHAAFARIDSDRFVTVEAPIDRDWSPRGATFLLRARSFRANGIAFDAPLSIYARFEPPPIALCARVRAEGFLHVSERGYTLTVKAPLLLAYEGELSSLDPAAWNRKLAQGIRANGPPEEAALIEAIVLGRGERLSDSVRDGFKRGGTYHLLVFSGLQIAFAAAILALALRWLHAPRASDWSLLAFALLAPLFIGPTASVARASVGIGLYALSRILKRPTSFENLWCVAALIELMIDPRVLADAGFQLTFAGAGALLFIGKSFAKRRWLAYALAAELTVAPLTLFHFHQFALGGSLLTILLTPVVFAMLVAGALACAIPHASLFAAIRLLHGACVAVNAFGSHASGYFAAPPLASLVVAAFASLTAIAMLRGRARALAIAFAMLIPTGTAIVNSLNKRDVGQPTITFLDVGQGDAIVLRSGTRNILVDAGGFESRLLPQLADRGIRHIDLAVLTHVHPDHCGAMPAAIARMRVDELWVSPRQFRGDCAQALLELSRMTHIHLVRDGEERTIGAIKLHAHVADRTFKRAQENNASIVLVAGIGKRRALLTGDIEKEAESWFSDRDLRADILKVAHHGSRSSSISIFLDVVTPRVAVISCGRRNLFGHPHANVLESLDERGVRTWRTDRNGSIDVELRDGHIFVRPQIDTPISAGLE